jgi:hypothetical protein
MRLTLALLLLPSLAQADDCTARLADLVSRPAMNGQPHEALVTVAVDNQRMVMRYQNLSERHQLVEIIEPTGDPGFMLFENGYYAPDGAGGWAYLEPSNIDAQQANFARMRAAQAAGILTATCGAESRDGITYDRIDGSIGPFPPFDNGMTLRYLLLPETQVVAVMENSYDLDGVVTNSSFVFTLTPDLTLPTP